MTPNDLPPVNAALNLISAVLLLLAYKAIRAKNESLHRKYVLAALFNSSIFLVCYLIFHFFGQVPPFGGTETMKKVFFFILATHTILAAFVPPMVIVTVYFALKNQRPRHKKIAPWTLSVWFYVSVTGVLIYLIKLPYY
ncbi:MAG: hypothetical protein BroJett040_05860 [Oligoflexia bacterium]|nr:MAG: hypothetical protein BroJett040_05860 [Oligoflexia bacterium]